jgi:uncharacterized protein (TIGR02996 family)
MSDEAAILSAIIAHPDEDTPRLVYADWLTEHGDPDRAEFIRVQCLLASISPGDPRWINLTERLEELDALLQHRRDLTRFGSDVEHICYGGMEFAGKRDEYRRGFPYYATCQVDGDKWTPEECARIEHEWERLARTTTLRGFGSYHWTGPSIDSFLASPGAALLDALYVSPEFDIHGPWQGVRVAVTNRVARSPELRSVRSLTLNADLPSGAVAALASSTAFDALRQFKFGELLTFSWDVEKLIQADWFRRLERIECEPGLAPAAVSLVRGLGELPGLHTLTLNGSGAVRGLAADAYPALASSAFPTLARLVLMAPLDAERARYLARSRFPQLVEFQTDYSAAGNGGLLALLGGEWIGRLRSVEMRDCDLTDRGVRALAEHPVAQNLRVLQLIDNPFGQGGLDALVRAAFPALTTLSLAAENKQKRARADLAKFLAAIEIPTLKHLDLSGWPLGDAGAKALAKNPAFGSLTSLRLNRCKIGDAGARALLASPHLRNLVRLHLDENTIRPAGVKALADPGVLPHLSECSLAGLPLDIEEQFNRPKLYVCV